MIFSFLRKLSRISYRKHPRGFDKDPVAVLGSLQRNRIFQSVVFVEELRLDFRCHYKSETLTDLCTEAVNVWKATALGLYNPLHSQTIFGNAELTRKLSRLEVSVVCLFYL